MKGTLLVFAAVVFLARAAVEEDDLVLDVLRNVKRTVGESSSTTSGFLKDKMWCAKKYTSQKCYISQTVLMCRVFLV